LRPFYFFSWNAKGKQKGQEGQKRAKKSVVFAFFALLALFVSNPPNGASVSHLDITSQTCPPEYFKIILGISAWSRRHSRKPNETLNARRQIPCGKAIAIDRAIIARSARI
jgi:hypothetical protein